MGDWSPSLRWSPWTGELVCPWGSGPWVDLQDLSLLLQGGASRPTGNTHMVLDKPLHFKWIRHPCCQGCWWSFASLISWGSGADPVRFGIKSRFFVCLWVYSTPVAFLVTVLPWLLAAQCSRSKCDQIELFQPCNVTYCSNSSTGWRFSVLSGKRRIPYFSDRKA